MLFNSYPFLFVFLPICLVGFFAIGRYGKGFGAAWLGLASLFFYGWWDYRYVLLLLASIVGNFFLGRAIARRARTPPGKRLLTIAVIANLLLLGYYKYADFFLQSLAEVTGDQLGLMRVVLPLGISFFTFTQIAFLVDAYRGQAAEYRFVNYLLFVSYFPHLIAGPVLHHREMMPQFDLARTYRAHASNFTIGLTIFFLGLAKKVLIADNLAEHANAVFATSEPKSLFIAWGGVLAYTFQLYFDFSGYSDMAIGLSRLFGIKLPLNFNSPYKAVNMIEFWRRWHMTLSRFLRDYLYIPLGGSQRGRLRRYVNLMLTMLLGGLWHGAGWNFVLWGGLHGSYLVVNHLWSEATANARWRSRTSLSRTIASVALTFLLVSVAWVFFRAPDVPTARSLLIGMAGMSGVALPDALVNRIPVVGPWLEAIGVELYLGGTTQFVKTWLWIAVGAFVAFLMPNTQEFMRRFSPALPNPAQEHGHELPTMLRAPWRPSARWAFLTAVLATLSLLSLTRPSEFLYFQF
jgi:D-alanyl-lipoteichoic acid acyltransferase DltB (MBOAT superfamily)